MNGSAAGTPRGANTNLHYNKNDLMAALTAVVTSGSPSASLRKTRGPGKGGVNEVFSSRRTSGTTTPNGTEKQVCCTQYRSAWVWGNCAEWDRKIALV